MNLDLLQTTPVYCRNLIALCAMACFSWVQAATGAMPNDFTWQIQTVNTSASAQLKPYSAIALDSSGSPHIIFQRNRQPFQSTGDIFHAFQTGDAWNVIPVASCTQCNVHVDAAIDNQDRLHIVYTDGINVQYGVRANSSWQIQNVNTPGTVANYGNIAVDEAGIPHVSFSVVHGISSTAHYATLSGGTWNVEPVAPSYFPYDIALDHHDRPHVVGGSTFLRMASRSLAGWTLEDVGVGGLGASLAFDHAGRPHIGHAVINSDDLRYATKNNGDWTNALVHHLGPGAAGPSLALGPNGRPRMTFEINLGGENDQVMHTYFDGSVWTTGVIDPLLSTESGTALVVGPGGVSHVVYSVQNGELRYARGIVPEPSSICLLSIALIGIACHRHCHH